MKKWVAGAVFGLAGFGLALLATLSQGLGLAMDSGKYLCCARNLLEGNGFCLYDGSPYVCDPPLFPMVLAFLGFLGIHPVDGARFGNAVFFGLTVAGFNYLLRMGLRSKTFVVLGTLSVLMSVPLIQCASSAESEALFCVLLVAFIILLHKFLDRPRFGMLLAVSAIAALACLQRYIGVTLIITGMLVIPLALKDLPWSRKARYCAVFCVIASIPLALWMIRNQMTASVFTGFRTHSLYTFTQHITANFDVLSGWLFPVFPQLRLWIRLVVIVAAGGLLFFACKGRKLKLSGTKWGLTRTVSVFFLVYVTVLFCISITTNIEQIPDRYLAPVYFAFFFMVWVLLEKISGLLMQKRLLGLRAGYIVVILCMVWLGFEFFHVCSRMPGVTHKSMRLFFPVHSQGAFVEKQIADTSMVRWLNANLSRYMVYSNNPPLVYAYCGMRSKWAPAYRKDCLFGFATDVCRYDNACLVRFNCFECIDMSPALQLLPLAEFPEGAVFSMSPRKTEAMAVLLNNQGLFYLNSGEFIEAESFFDKALQLAPKNIPAHYNMACLRARQYRIDEAISYLKKAVGLGFDNWESLENDSDLINLRQTRYFEELIKKSRNQKLRDHGKAESKVVASHPRWQPVAKGAAAIPG